MVVINIFDTDEDGVDHFVANNGNYNLNAKEAAKILSVDIAVLNKFIRASEVFKADSVVTRIDNRRIVIFFK